MDWMNMLAFALVATLLVISPGPNGVLITKSAATGGVKAGFANIAGFVGAFYLHGALSVFGISILLVQSAEAFTLFKLVGAAYLCWLGVKSIRSAMKHEQTVTSSIKTEKKQSVSLSTSFAEGFITNALNPKVSMFYLAAFPQFIAVGENALQAFTLVSVHAVINVIWFSALVCLVVRLGGLASSPRMTKVFKSVSGAVFIGFGAKLALLEK